MQIELLDFGASREFDKSFVDVYVALLKAASRADRELCKELSLKLGYLTGYETQVNIIPVFMKNFC